MAQRYASLYERILAHVEKPEGQNENGCWLWTGGLRKGYARMNVRIDGKHTTLAVHRTTYELVHGVKLTPEETLDHICRATRCINPDHTEVVTNAENARRSYYDNPRLKGQKK